MRDPNRAISDLIGEYVGKLGEKIEVRRFVRFQLGETAGAQGDGANA